MVGAVSGEPADLEHVGLLYHGDDDLLAVVSRFVRAGRRSEEPVLLALPADRLGRLRKRLGPDGDRLPGMDMVELGRNPGRIVGALLDFARAQHGRRVRIVTEPLWSGRSAAETRQVIRHEELLPAAFAGTPARILCPYDADALPAAALAGAVRTHPTMLEHGHARRGPAPGRVPAEPALDAVPGSATTLRFAAGDLTTVRHRVRRWAAGAGMSPQRGDDLTLAVHEVLSNSVAYGGGRGRLRLWVEGPRVVAEICDAGRLADPLAGRRRPDLESTAGRGLWVVHQLCDLVETRTTADGLTTRLHLARNGTG